MLLIIPPLKLLTFSISMVKLLRKDIRFGERIYTPVPKWTHSKENPTIFALTSLSFLFYTGGQLATVQELRLVLVLPVGVLVLVPTLQLR